MTYPEAPRVVAHYGMERTTFYWHDGTKSTHEGYCGWRNGEVYRDFDPPDPSVPPAMKTKGTFYTV